MEEEEYQWNENEVPDNFFPDLWNEAIKEAWDWYFGDDEPPNIIKEDVRVSFAADVAKFLEQKKHESSTTTQNLEGGYYEIDVDCMVPINYQELQQKLNPKWVKSLNENPGIAIPCVALGCYLALKKDFDQNPRKKLMLQQRRIMPRIFNFSTITPLRHLKSNLIGRFVSIKGTVVRVGNIKPMVMQMSFTCANCDNKVSCYFKDGKYRNPTKCATPNCRGKTFVPDYESCISVDWQQIRIQEQTDRRDPGRIPRTIEVELAEDLVDSCVPGDIVTICGEVKVINTESEKGFRSKDKNKALFFIYLEANSLDNSKEVDNGRIDNMTMKEKLAIQEIANEKNLFRVMVNSICPTIYGHELVKAGLVLTLFGGTTQEKPRYGGLSVRGNPHMLIVGDPGLGKSQMLTAITNIAPRGVYVCGSYSSSTGLTVSIIRESGSGDYALEAGALVLGDQGICCIDEFDKMANEHQALMEAMEQQCISIAKAGIVCNLLARTSIIAAANPVGGHYNRAKTVSENLKMNNALLSRFDLIFIILDKPDEEKDQMISEHVMALHEDKELKYMSSQEVFSAHSNQSGTLAERLRVKAKEVLEPIHPLLLRKYIAFARKHVQPKLSAEACEVIQEFYLTLRDKHRSADSTPITTRQLESLIRLTQARAKLELRNTVTAEDAKDVVEIMKESLFERMEDEYGNIDFRRVTGMSKAKEATRFVSLLEKKARMNNQVEFTKQELYQAYLEIGMQAGTIKFEEFIEALNTQNYLLKRKNGYKLTSIAT